MEIFFHGIRSDFMGDEQPIIKYVVDIKTGEIVDELYAGDRYRITRSQQIEYYKKNRKEIEGDKMFFFGQDESFSMLSEFSARQLADEKLTSAEYRVLLIMISNTHYKSGLVAFKNNRPITEEWLAEHLGLTDRTIKNSIKTLVDKGIINRSTTNHKTQYFFNPFIQYRGRWINRTLYEMFKNTKWAKRK